MKISITYLALLGLSCAHLTIIGRAPQGPTPPGNQIIDAIKDGIKDWGPAGSLKPPTSPNPPLRQMPGSPRPHHKFKDPSIKTGVTRVPGQPLGPQKKCRPCRRKRQLCCGSPGDSIKPWKPQTKGSSKANNGRPAYKSSKIRVTKAAGKATAFALLVPYARDLLEAVKQWDNEIGLAVRWFDNAIALIQEAIGGPQRHDIDGNDLKAKLICALKGGQEQDIIQGRKSHVCTSTADKFKQMFRDESKDGTLSKSIGTCEDIKRDREDQRPRGGSPHASSWGDSMCEALFRSDEYAEWQWERGLNYLLDICYSVETDPQENKNGLMDERCAAFQAQVEEVEKGEKKPEVEEKPCDEKCKLLNSLAGGGGPRKPFPGSPKHPEPSGKSGDASGEPVVVEEIPEKIKKIPDEDLEKATPLAELTLKQKDQLGRYGDVVTELKNETSNAHTCYDNYRSNSDKAIASPYSIEDCDKQYFKVQSLLRNAREIREEPDFPPGLEIFWLPDVQDGRTSLQHDATKELQDILQGLTKVAGQASIFQKQAERLLSDKNASVD